MNIFRLNFFQSVKVLDRVLLLPCKLIFIIGAVIRTVIGIPPQKSVHFVFVQIYKTHIAFIFVVIKIVHAFIAVCSHIFASFIIIIISHYPVFVNKIPQGICCALYKYFYRP